MKKVIFLILFFIAFNSINSIAKYSNIVEYNFFNCKYFISRKYLSKFQFIY